MTKEERRKLILKISALVHDNDLKDDISDIDKLPDEKLEALLTKVSEKVEKKLSNGLNGGLNNFDSSQFSKEDFFRN